MEAGKYPRNPAKVFALPLLLCFFLNQLNPGLVFAAPGEIQNPSEIYVPEKTLQPDESSEPAPFEILNLEDPFAAFLTGNTLSASQGSLGIITETVAAATVVFATSIPPDPSAPPITKIPVNAAGKRPEWQSSVSYDPSNPDPALQDWSNFDFIQFSQSASQVNFNLYNTFSEGSLFLDYDDSATTAIETVNLQAAFPSGVVLELNNGGKSTSEVLFELTDDQGIARALRLIGITENSQRWKLDLSVFNLASIDLTKIRKVALKVEGRQVDGRLNVSWGDASYTPVLYSSPSNPQTPTPLPVHAATTDLPVLKEYVSFNPDPHTGDWSDADLRAYSNNFAQLNFTLYNTYSQAGAYVEYDNPATGGTEFSDFNAAFPDGIVLGLDNGGFPAVQEVSFIVRDTSGREDVVRLAGIQSNLQYFKIPKDLFEEVDLGHIAFVEILVEGRHSSGGRLNITWGNFTTPVFLQGNTLDETGLTQLPVTGKLTEFGGDFNSPAPSGQIALTRLSAEEFEYQYTLWNSETAYTTLDITAPDNQSFSLPQKFVLALRGTEGGQTKVQFTDAFNRTATFVINLKSTYQNYELELTGEHMPHFFQHNQIKQIRFLQDRNTNPVAYSDLIKVKIKGLEYSTDYLSPELQAFKNDVIQKGLDYFAAGEAIDPVTHFPYDRRSTDGTVDPTHKITQPTLTGFYLQMLGDFVRGKLAWDGKTIPDALAEIDHVVDSLLDLQQEHGWNGLIPWIDQGEPYDNVGLGDNANLSQSLAVMIGALEMANLTPQQRAAAEAITVKAEHFMDLQQPGYEMAVDPTFGLFPQKILRDSGVPVGFIDRLLTEFRGAIVFLLARYPTLPRSIFDNLTYTVDFDYKNRNGNTIINLQSYEGGAFQYFWPLLRNNERDYVGFRNALYNYYVTSTDFAATRNIPGFLSASDMPDNLYQGLQGIPQIAETSDPLLIDLGSTYSLASAFAVNQYSVLEWLNSIKKQLPETYGIFGFADSARSGTDVNKFYLGIDIASSILGLTNAGPEAFETYLRNRDLEVKFNKIYDERGRFGLGYTYEAAVQPPVFPDKSFNVFNHVKVDGTLGDFPYSPTTVAGARFFYNSFGTGFDGRFWEFDETYDAQAHELELLYSVTNSPKKLRIEIKDGSVPEKLLFQTVVTVAGDNSPQQKLIVPIPNDTLLAGAKKLFILPDQSTGDTAGDFMVHAINFKHYPSSQELLPLAGRPEGETTVDQPYAETVFSAPPGVHGEIIAPKTFRLYYDVTGQGAYAAYSMDPSLNEANEEGLFDLSQKSRIVFGLSSDKAKKVRIEIMDDDGTAAVFYATDINITRNYYAFLTASLPSALDLQRVRRINFVVNHELLAPEDFIGSFDVEIL